MPTHEEDAQFLREFAALTLEERSRYLDAMRKMVNDLKAGQPFAQDCALRVFRGILASSR